MYPFPIEQCVVFNKATCELFLDSNDAVSALLQVINCLAFIFNSGFGVNVALTFSSNLYWYTGVELFAHRSKRFFTLSKALSAPRCIVNIVYSLCWTIFHQKNEVFFSQSLSVVVFAISWSTTFPLPEVLIAIPWSYLSITCLLP